MPKKKASKRRPPTEAPPMPVAATWQAKLALGWLCLLLITVYGKTMAPSLYGGDSGEFITSACTHGVAHPPGYPLYHLLGGLACAVPQGSWAIRLNIFSALCSIIAALLIFASVWRWTKLSSCALLGATLFALSPLCWRYSITAEVFALNNVLVAGLLACLACAKEAPERSTLGALFICGLGVCHHHTLMLVGLPVVTYLLVRSWRRVQPYKLGLAVAAGLLPLLYMVWAGRAAGPLDWGDTAHWQGFFDHLLRRQYGTFRLARTGAGSGAFAFLWNFVTTCLPQLSLFGLPLGAALLWRGLVAGEARLCGRLLWGIVATYLAVFALLGNLSVEDALSRDVLARFYLLPMLLLAAMAGLAAAALLRGHARLQRFALPVVMLWSVGWAAYNYPSQDLHALTLYRDFGAAMLKPAPPNAMLLVTGDLQLHALRYVTEAEQLRPDVRLLDWGHLRTPWGQARAKARYPDLRLPPGEPRNLTLRGLLDANVGHTPLVLGYDEQSDTSWREAYTMWPAGLLRLPRPLGQSLPAETLLAQSEQGLPHLQFSAAAEALDPWQSYLQEQVWRSYSYTGHYLLNVAAHSSDPPIFLRPSIAAMETVTKNYARAPADDFKTLGEAYAQSLSFAPQNATKMDEAWRAYLNRAQPDEKDVPIVRARLRDPQARK